MQHRYTFGAFCALTASFFGLHASADDTEKKPHIIESNRGGNSVSIKQIGDGNRVHIRQSNPDATGETAESAIIDSTDESGNRAVIIQQGNTNVSEFTDRGRLQNIVNSGAITPPAAQVPAAGFVGGVTVQQTGTGSAPTVTNHQ